MWVSGVHKICQISPSRFPEIEIGADWAGAKHLLEKEEIGRERKSFWGQGGGEDDVDQDDDDDDEIDGMVMVRTMTIMRIGASRGEGRMNGGEVKEAKTIDAGGQELLSPPSSSFIYRKASMWGERGSMSGPELCLSWRRIHNGICGSAVYVYCVFTCSRTCSRTLKWKLKNCFV